VLFVEPAYPDDPGSAPAGEGDPSKILWKALKLP
jgi:hypothetical protein